MRIGYKPTVDVIFKRIFATPSHAHLTKSFLNELLPLVGAPRLESLEILNPFRLSEFVGDREIAVDVRAKDESGRDFQIEMQVRNDGALAPRMLDNWARLYTAQVAKGEDYRRHRPVVSVWILSGSFFPDEAWLHAFRAEDEARRSRLSEDFLIVTVELAKRGLPSALPSRALGATFPVGFDEWLWFLAHGEDFDPENPAFDSLREETREAAEVIVAFTKQERARYTYERRLEWERTMAAWKADARAEGLAEGRAEGKAEGKAEGLEEGRRTQALEDARKLRDLGADPELILKATGLRPEDLP